MAVARLSQTFSYNYFFWRLLGIWPTETSSNYYKFYSALCLFVFIWIYNFLLTINLFFSPRDIELLIIELIFYFTVLAAISKVFMILRNQKRILEVYDLLDSASFKATDDISKDIIEKHVQTYKTCWKAYLIFCNFSYMLLIIMPVIMYLIFNSELSLPICNYYFLSDVLRDTYFRYWFFYQAFGIYGVMTYDIHIDTFVGGLILMAIAQLKVLNHKLNNVKLEALELKEKKYVQERIAMTKLMECLRHYDNIIKYCSLVQKIISVSQFVQYGMASAIICSCLYCFTMPIPSARYVFMVCYCTAMLSEIFLPGWLGSDLSYQNSKLVEAAYYSEWIPRSENFKRNLRLFILRANSPMVLKGGHMFPLTLNTFILIMRTAYSLFALVRNVKDRQSYS